MNGARQGTVQDLSEIQFRPGNGLRVAEFLQAIPMVKGQPIDVLAGSSSGPHAGESQMQVSVQVPFFGAPSQNPVYTDLVHPQVVDTRTAPAAVFTLVRFGLAVNALKIDQSAAVPNTAGDTSSSLIKNAVVQLLRALDTALGQGPGGAAPQYFDGLSQISGRKEDASNIELGASLALSQIYPTGRGAGAGPDCFMGCAPIMRALMATPSGQGGSSGWRYDSRTGLNVYHYMGIPFYRVDAEITPGEPTTASLYACNLGPTGLNLVHAYGNAESYGLQIDEQPIATTLGMRQFLVHGAYALVLWEKEALYEVNNIDVTNYLLP